MNLYWPMYKNLESELLELSNYIHFSDDQESVYSPHISDLLIRTASEIEAIAKELYQRTGGNMNPNDEMEIPAHCTLIVIVFSTLIFNGKLRKKLSMLFRRYSISASLRI